jgi:hypothetical protein
VIKTSGNLVLLLLIIEEKLFPQNFSKLLEKFHRFSFLYSPAILHKYHLIPLVAPEKLSTFKNPKRVLLPAHEIFKKRELFPSI